MPISGQSPPYLFVGTYVQALFDLLAANGYRLTESEVKVFMPGLVEKCGQPQPNVKADCRCAGAGGSMAAACACRCGSCFFEEVQKKTKSLRPGTGLNCRSDLGSPPAGALCAVVPQGADGACGVNVLARQGAALHPGRHAQQEQQVSQPLLLSCWIQSTHKEYRGRDT